MYFTRVADYTFCSLEQRSENDINLRHEKNINKQQHSALDL